uniref:HAD family hydrolase n=1 Tax=Streptomyces candidus TaxID=67283 RepID=A0A516ELB7_9ACTN|nr:PyrC [Streptomyces candidus]QDX19142.1 HAD family hydrolase [Streptomyces candidus]
MLEAVVFDLDGTLVDTPAAIGATLVEVLAGEGFTVDHAAVAATIGKPLVPSVAGLLELAADDQAVRTVVTRYQRLFDERVLGRGTELLYAGVADGLAALRGSGLSCAIATSKDLRVATALLGSSGIAAHFPVVITHDQVAQGKPHPEMGLCAAADLGVDAGACAYVGDAVGDMEMAVAAGMTPIGVAYGVASAAELTEHGAVQVCADFAEVVKAVSALAGRRTN